MAERTIVTELIQLGIESTYGTSVAATRRLASLGFDLSPELDTTRVRPIGYKVDTIVAPVRQWASGDIMGYPAYNELPYIWESLIKTTTPSTTTGVTTWTHDWSPTSVENVKSYTLEQGDPNTRAHKVTGALITDFNVGWTRTGDPDMGGTVLAQAFTDGITPTGSLAIGVPIPILPGHIDVYSDALWANRGTTKLLRVMSVALSIGGMWGPLWALNTTATSFANYVQQAPDVTVELVLEADSAGNAFFTQMAAGTMIVIEIKATGPNISGGVPTTPNSVKIDVPCVIEGPPDFGDTDGVRTATWPLRGIVDGTSGKALLITTINGLAAL